MEASAIEIRLRNHEVRLDANHDSIAKIRDTSARHETEISVMRSSVRMTEISVS